MAHIKHLAVNALVAWLTQKLITEVAEDDPTRAKLVKGGLLQDDPNVNYNHVLVHAGDPSDKDYVDELYHDILRSPDDQVAPYYIGGGSDWWRKGCCDIGCFFLTQGYDRDTARDHATTFLGRLEASVANCQAVLGLVDEFGETSHEIYVIKSRFAEGGGPPTQHIWRGKVHWALRTSKE